MAAVQAFAVVLAVGVAVAVAVGAWMDHQDRLDREGRP